MEHTYSLPVSIYTLVKSRVSNHSFKLLYLNVCFVYCVLDDYPGLSNFDQLSTWCHSNLIDLVVVGPEDPLANGISDSLTKNGTK